MTEARFKINGTLQSAAGFDATAGQVLTLQLEDSPALDARKVAFSVARKSKGAPDLVFAPGSGEPTTPTGTVTVTMPGSGVHSYILRCVVNDGIDTTNKVVAGWTKERVAVVRSVNGRRKIIASESTQYEPDGWAGAQNDDVDALFGYEASTISWKQPVRLALASGAGAPSGLAAIDGVTPIAGDRVVRGVFPADAFNGIWVAAAGAWTRAADADSAAELPAGATVQVSEGTAYAGSLWSVRTTGAVTLGTTALDVRPGFTSLGLGAGAQAAGGALRFTNASEVRWRNAAGNADVTALRVTNANAVVLGEDTNAARVEIRSADETRVHSGGVEGLRMSYGDVSLYAAAPDTAANSLWGFVSRTTAGTGADLRLRAQGAVSTSRGGALILDGGANAAGTPATQGGIQLRPGGNLVLEVGEGSYSPSKFRVVSSTPYLTFSDYQHTADGYAAYITALAKGSGAANPFIIEGQGAASGQNSGALELRTVAGAGGGTTGQIHFKPGGTSLLTLSTQAFLSGALQLSGNVVGTADNQGTIGSSSLRFVSASAISLIARGDATDTNKCTLTASALTPTVAFTLQPSAPAAQTAGRALTLRGGDGGVASAGAGGAGAAGVLIGGTGGAGTAGQAAGAGGLIRIWGGDAGANNGGGGAASGLVDIQAGAPTGAGLQGDINIGTSLGANVYVGKAGSCQATFGATDTTFAWNATQRLKINATGLGFFTATPVAQPSAYTVTNHTNDRALNESADTLVQVANVLGTLINDLKGLGLVG